MGFERVDPPELVHAAGRQHQVADGVHDDGGQGRVGNVVEDGWQGVDG